MYYGFRVRPFARLFGAVILVWMAYTCLYAARHAPIPTSAAVLFMITSGLFFLGALVVLRGLWRLFRAYGRTWIG